MGGCTSERLPAVALLPCIEEFWVHGILALQTHCHPLMTSNLVIFCAPTVCAACNHLVSQSRTLLPQLADHYTLTFVSFSNGFLLLVEAGSGAFL
ncbi:hypothetical protein CONLIGDRAFT_105744 [Coniochaeta ligniaria NRRL 30616]|uniref:Uncharacterized protein n=1 Tax=Coniochaeta ligniaria NRRL 30616 TaxID=1408157 RepID=A0A1J7IAR0_9PEZI|nr:hypothetical protein CONLIGDRAFT_105744 [Coniochaeta ligniaria NRRL 30616]